MAPLSLRLRTSRPPGADETVTPDWWPGPRPQASFPYGPSDVQPPAQFPYGPSDVQPPAQFPYGPSNERPPPGYISSTSAIVPAVPATKSAPTATVSTRGAPGSPRTSATASATPPDNPNFGLTSYDVPGGGRTPYITTLNLGGGGAGGGGGGPLAFLQGLFGGRAPPTNTAAGVLANAVSAPEPGGPVSGAWLNKALQHHPGNFALSPDQLTTYMNTQPWLQGLGAPAGTRTANVPLPPRRPTGV
jgi:hypothetical protein